VPKTVLIADDNPRIRALLCELFEGQGYTVCGQADNGAEAIALARKLIPDVIVLDFSMPVMNGLEAAHSLKRIMPRVPIILFTQHSNTVLHMAAARRLPFDRIVAKADASGLMDCVRSLHPA
jgi:CheY-like chemotaxis protein